jgi:hypothetical protein
VFRKLQDMAAASTRSEVATCVPVRDQPRSRSIGQIVALNGPDADPNSGSATTSPRQDAAAEGKKESRRADGQTDPAITFDHDKACAERVIKPVRDDLAVLLLWH